jgi:hypothetical protein
MKKSKRHTLRDYRWSLPYGAWLCSDHVSIFNRRYIPIATRWPDGRIEMGATVEQVDRPKPVSTQECDANPTCPVSCRWHRFSFQMWFYDDGTLARTPHKKLIAELEQMLAEFIADGTVFRQALFAALLARIEKLKADAVAKQVKIDLLKEEARASAEEFDAWQAILTLRHRQLENIFMQEQMN